MVTTLEPTVASLSGNLVGERANGGHLHLHLHLPWAGTGHWALDRQVRDRQ